MKKDSERKHVKDIKIFWKIKRQKAKKAQQRYQNFTVEEKEKKRNKNLSEEQKQKLQSVRKYYGNC